MKLSGALARSAPLPLRNGPVEALLNRIGGSGGEPLLVGCIDREVPRQRFCDARDRVLGDAVKHGLQVTLGVELVEFGASQQAVNCGRSLAACI